MFSDSLVTLSTRSSSSRTRCARLRASTTRWPASAGEWPLQLATTGSRQIYVMSNRALSSPPPRRSRLTVFTSVEVSMWGAIVAISQSWTIWVKKYLKKWLEFYIYLSEHFVYCVCLNDIPNVRKNEVTGFVSREAKNIILSYWTSSVQSSKYCRRFDLLHSNVVKFCLVPLGSRVQCVARAVNTDRDPGLEIFSEPVTISRTDGLCEPRIMDSVGAEPFAARLRYTGQCACVLESAFPDPSSLSTYLDRINGLRYYAYGFVWWILTSSLIFFFFFFFLNGYLAAWKSLMSSLMSLSFFGTFLVAHSHQMNWHCRQTFLHSLISVPVRFWWPDTP